MADTSLTPRAAARRRHLRAIAVTVLLGIAAAGASSAASAFIAAAFPLRPTPRDLLFELLPFIEAAQYTADIGVYGALALLLYDVLRHRPRELTTAASALAMLYLLRAAFMVLTPLASAYGNGRLYGFVPIVQNGMWPSGHAAAALMCVLLLRGAPAPLRRTATALAWLTWVSLITGHAHYSIDVAGGLLLAYFVEREWCRGAFFGVLARATRWDADAPAASAVTHGHSSPNDHA